MLVTFVCVGNTCRSPLLKALFKRYAKECGFQCEVESAGLAVADGKISKETEKVLLEHGISVENQNTTTLTPFLCEMSDLIVAVDSFVAEKINAFHCESKVYALTSPLLLGEDMLDPYGKGYEAYQRIFNQGIEALPKILELAKILK